MGGGGDEEAPGAGGAGVAQELEGGALDVGEGRGGAAGSLWAGEAGEARAEVAVGAFFQRGPPYRATSLTRLSRITVTLIWPGYSRSLSICLEIS